MRRGKRWLLTGIELNTLSYFRIIPHMMKTKSILSFAAAILWVVPAFADIPETSVPAEVVSGVKSAYAQERKIELDFNNRTKQYEAEFRINGFDVEVKLTSDGKIVRVKEEIDPALTPEIVRTAALKDYPQGRIKEVKKITEGQTVSYDIEVVTDTEDYDLLISADGKVLRTER